MTHDPVHRFTDPQGNHYVGVDRCDIQHLADLLAAWHEVVSSPGIFCDLVEHLPPDRIKRLIEELGEQVEFVQHLTRTT